MAAPVTELLCILVDNNFQHTFGGAFLVEVPSNGIIAHLKDKIKEKNNDLPLVSRLLEVWNLHNPRGSSEIDQSLPNLTCLGEVLVEGEGQNEAARLVRAEEAILSHFSGFQSGRIGVPVRVPPPPQIGGSPHNTCECSINLLTPAYHIWRTRHHLNATPPSRDVVGLNRPQEEVADQTMEYLRKTPYSVLAPSDAAKASEFRRFQKNDKQRILNDRPSKDVRIAPIALLYSPLIISVTLPRSQMSFTLRNSRLPSTSFHFSCASITMTRTSDAKMS